MTHIERGLWNQIGGPYAQKRTQESGSDYQQRKVDTEYKHERNGTWEEPAGENPFVSAGGGENCSRLKLRFA